MLVPPSPSTDFSSFNYHQGHITMFPVLTLVCNFPCLLYFQWNLNLCLWLSMQLWLTGRVLVSHCTWGIPFLCWSYPVSIGFSDPSDTSVLLPQNFCKSLSCVQSKLCFDPCLSQPLYPFISILSSQTCLYHSLYLILPSYYGRSASRITLFRHHY